MKYWEISGNLEDEKDGLLNYQRFQDAVCAVKDLFDNVFGLEIMNKIPFLVDNATAGSGYTPICTAVLGRIVIIKLNINNEDEEEKIVYQFAHELTHVVFRSYLGINKPKANEEEEALCTAAALIALKKLYPSAFLKYKMHTATLVNSSYREGVLIAKSFAYDLKQIRTRIEEIAIH